MSVDQRGNMNINLNRIATVQAEISAVQQQIKSAEVWADRTGEDNSRTIAALEQRLIDLREIINRSGSGSYQPATPDEYGLVKYDDVTIGMYSNGQLYYKKQSEVDQKFEEILGVDGQRINTIEENVSTNASNIITNTTSIATNTDNISSLTNRVSINEGNISTINDTLTNKADLVSGYVPVNQLPPGVLDQFFSVATKEDLVTLTEAHIGDEAIITTGEEIGRQYVLTALPSSTESNWLAREYSTIGDYVMSVNNLTGRVTLGLANLPDVNSKFDEYLPLTGGELTGNITIPNQLNFTNRNGGSYISASNNTLYITSDGTAPNRIIFTHNNNGSLTNMGTIRRGDFIIYDENGGNSIGVRSSLNSKLDLSGGTMTGPLALFNSNVNIFGTANEMNFRVPGGGVRRYNFYMGNRIVFYIRQASDSAAATANIINADGTYRQL